MVESVRGVSGEGGARVLVDSLREAYAYVDAYPHSSGPWTILAEIRSNRDGGATLTLDLSAPDGDSTSVIFKTGHFGATGGIRRFGVEPTLALDELMSGVSAFVAENPPFHPGSLPRFPVPSRRYPGRVEVPVAILAMGDDGRSGLFAPARVVVVSLSDGRPYGIGDFPGFDPDNWPPERLGNWPPAATMTLPRGQLAATVARFNGVWLRVLTAAATATTYPSLHQERREAVTMLSVLDAPEMAAVYRTIHEEFWDGLQEEDGSE